MSTQAGKRHKKVIGLSAEAPIPVSRAIRRIRKIVTAVVTGPVWVSGEVADLRRDAAGNVRFVLEHDGCGISCIIWASTAPPDQLSLTRGMSVAAFARLGVYDKDARVHATVSRVCLNGPGEQKRQLECLRERLRRDGLLDPRRKRQIPDYPRRVATITSVTGAALQDILAVARRRHPGIQLLVIPAVVQGAGAPESVCRALGIAQRAERCDTVIVARGGGASVDLAAFNDEAIGRAIASCRIPVITAIGHETDHSIADEVADLRVSTPSAAAERAIPDRAHLIQSLGGLQGRAREAMASRVARATKKLDRTRLTLSHALGARCQRHVLRVTRCREHLSASMRARAIREHSRFQENRAGLFRSLERRLEREHARLTRLETALRALDPEGVLSRGYAILLDARGQVVSSIADVQRAGTVIVRMHDGELAGQFPQTSTSEESARDPKLRAKCSSSRSHRQRTR